MKIFSREIDTSKVVKVFAGTGTIVGAFLGINSLLDVYHNKTMDNLCGEWKLTTITETTTFKKFEGMELGFKVFINQDGKRIVAKGEKYWENGNTIPYTAHTPIELSGICEGSTLRLNFEQKGLKRATTGNLILKKSSADKYEGTFSSTVADSKGKVFLVKMEN